MRLLLVTLFTVYYIVIGRVMQETLRQLHSVCGRSHESLLAADVQQLVNYSIVKSFLQHTSTNESFI